MKRFIFALVLVFVLSFSMCSSPAPPGGGTVMLDDTGSVSDSCCGIATSPPTGCLNCCTDGLSRYKCVAIKNVGDAVGAKATIRVRLGQLCGDLSRLGQMGAWVGIQNDTQPYRFCQIGYVRHRETGLAERTYYFMEWAPSHDPYVPVQLKEHTASVIDGAACDLQVYVKPGTDTIEFTFPETTYVYGTAGRWTNQYCKNVVWCGEIAGRESDMPGTAGNTCDFTNCGYWRLNVSSPTTATFDNTFLIDCNPPVGGQPDEWRIDHGEGTDSLAMWDEYPL